jgi:hypothetical protein
MRETHDGFHAGGLYSADEELSSLYDRMESQFCVNFLLDSFYSAFLRWGNGRRRTQKVSLCGSFRKNVRKRSRAPDADLRFLMFLLYFYD